jgi:hypothetical protein
MERQDRVELIVRKINVLDMCKREHVSRCCWHMRWYQEQTNNGVYCIVEQLSDEVIEVVYDYLLINLK